MRHRNLAFGGFKGIAYLLMVLNICFMTQHAYAVSAEFDIRVEVIETPVIEVKQGIDFGNISLGESRKITVSPLSGGGAQLVSGRMSITIPGNGVAGVALIFPTEILLTNSETNGVLTVKNFNFSYEGTLFSSGQHADVEKGSKQEMRIGATLFYPGNISAGRYHGVLQVNMSYMF
ncbi:DUF4402 domain-containing protein [Oceanospirillum sediminis]|uniref:DUF4402 domain-containing protein n=1 Tax=Oceanospirillum sediminis TaxID=2760088 RepID=A0A839IXP3_9GAMM|nr:DUF4402 domain-containing protein [Oceanospirillum sediminis]MBB1488856.1 DUF4402 domain-containing protein [Oceanospirillum sediminis]